MGSFHVDKSHQKASVEVDNDLYGFTRQQDMHDANQPENRYEYNTPGAHDAVQADNPLYGDEHKDVSANNPMYGGSNAPAGAQEADVTYSNINFDNRTIQMGTDSDYSYCKH